LDAEYGIAKDDLDATQLRLRGLRSELKQVDADLKKLRPDADKKAKAVQKAEDNLSGLQDEVDEAEEGVFAAFCKKIKVGSIREYEDVQVKLAREESEALEVYAQQQARAKHQSVHSSRPANSQYRAES
jgi:structural maintenance of chromosome 1